MKKVKQVFPSRNYITVDSFGDVEVIFNPVGDGFEGDDKLTFRKGRWAFRVNDFLSGKIMADGSKEGMNRKVYSLNLIYDDEDGEPLVNTTYVDPTSVIPLDGSLVDIVGMEDLAQRKYQLRRVPAETEEFALDLTKRRYPQGAVFVFADRYVALRCDSVLVEIADDSYLLLGDFSEYKGGVVQRLNALTFASADVEKIFA